MRWLSALAVGAILSGFAFLLLTGQYIQEGPVVVSLTHTHGLHAGDLFVIGGWVVGMAALGLLMRAPRRSAPPDAAVADQGAVGGGRYGRHGDCPNDLPGSARPSPPPQ